MVVFTLIRSLCYHPVHLLSSDIDFRIYTLVCSFIMIAASFSTGTFPHTSSANQYIRTFLSTPNGVVVIALASTYWAYVASAILSLDIWHLLTSFVQYNAMTLSYINILNVYAFCNWHDVSWGTKGSDKADSLPSAQTTKRSDDDMSIEVLEYELPQADIDGKFEKVVKKALAPYKKTRKNEESTMDDSYRGFRTNFIVAWLFS